MRDYVLYNPSGEYSFCYPSGEHSFDTESGECVGKEQLSTLRDKH